jgi:hypothetical protein
MNGVSWTVKSGDGSKEEGGRKKERKKESKKKEGRFK